jgi:acyl-CoA thioester hydrolase
MIIDKIEIRPRYGEVDQMGYVYHANYVSYCHQARTELLRKFGICDHILEENDIMLPVIEMNLRYFKPSHYDEKLTITTIIREIPLVRFRFEFKITNDQQEKVCQASSTVVFVERLSRRPIKVPELVENALMSAFETVSS